MADTHETIADIVAEKRRQAEHIRNNLSTVPVRQWDQQSEIKSLEDDADRLEAAHKREISEKESVIQAVESARTSEVSKLKDEIDELKKQVGNMAKLLDALASLIKSINNFVDRVDYYGIDSYYSDCYNKHRETLLQEIGKAEAALAAPPRNCDRHECATTKAAQDVWRKEDGGKTAYYEWILATYKEGGNDGK